MNKSNDSHKPDNRVLRILYLDDDPSDSQIFTSILSVMDPTGYIVSCVDNTALARVLLDRESFDIIVSDYRLDQTEGGTSTKFILEVLERSNYIPVVLTSGQTHLPLETELHAHMNQGRLRFIDKGALSVDGLGRIIKAQVNQYFSVLVADDDAATHKGVTDCLAVSNLHTFALRHAYSIDEARAEAVKTPADIYICDWQFGPDQSTDWLLELAESQPNSCIILLTGHEAAELPASILRMLGHRRISFHSKGDLIPARFEQHVMHHLNRMVGTHYSRN